MLKTGSCPCPFSGNCEGEFGGGVSCDSGWTQIEELEGHCCRAPGFATRWNCADYKEYGFAKQIKCRKDEVAKVFDLYSGDNECGFGNSVKDHNACTWCGGGGGDMELAQKKPGYCWLPYYETSDAKCFAFDKNIGWWKPDSFMKGGTEIPLEYPGASTAAIADVPPFPETSRTSSIVVVSGAGILGAAALLFVGRNSMQKRQRSSASLKHVEMKDGTTV